MSPRDLDARLRPAHSRETHVQKHDVGPQAIDFREPALGVFGLPDHLEVGLGRQDRGQPLSYDRVVVDDQDADGRFSLLTRASMRTPRGFAARMRKEPPTCSTDLRMFATPARGPSSFRV